MTIAPQASSSVCRFMVPPLWLRRHITIVAACQCAEKCHRSVTVVSLVSYPTTTLFSSPVVENTVILDNAL